MSTTAVPQQANMSPAKLLFRSFASFPVMVAALFVMLTVLSVRSRFDDPDLGWHLRQGELTWQSHHVLTTDQISYTTHHTAYVAHEWLSELGMYAVYHVAGNFGVMICFCVIAALLLVANYLVGWLYSADPKVAVGGTLLVWYFAMGELGPRPQVLGYLFLTAEIGILELGRFRNPRYLFALPPLFAIWINCHGSWFLGLLIAVAALVCANLRIKAGPLQNVLWAPVARKTLLAAVLLIPFALLIDPAHGPIGYPLNLMRRQHTTLAQVTEFHALQFDDPRAIALLTVFGLCIAVPLLRRARIPLFELCCLALGAIGACLHVRLLFAFGILAAPLFCKALAGLLEEYRLEDDLPYANLTLITIALFIAAFALPRPANLEAQLVLNSPVRAVEFIKQHSLPGPILNEFEYGGYLAWKAPEYPTFIDGRADVFDWTGVFDQMARWAWLQEDPRLLPDRYGVNLCILKPTSAAGRMLLLLGGWKLVYTDDNAMVLVRTKPVSRLGHTAL